MLDHARNVCRHLLVLLSRMTCQSKNRDGDPRLWRGLAIKSTSGNKAWKDLNRSTGQMKNRSFWITWEKQQIQVVQVQSTELKLNRNRKRK